MVIEHFIAGISVPHNEGAIPLTKESYDPNNPQKRLTDFSKTITLPESKQLNQILEHAFDVNVSFQTFNPNKKTSYRVVQDGVTLLNGFCQLKSINEIDGKVTYSIVATGQIGDLFEKIKDLKLSDIDFADLTHTYSQANVVASWTPTLGTGYVYPMINLGGRTNFIYWNVTDFKPAIFLKEYIDRIFAAQGYTINSNFFHTTLFKSLIIPFTGAGVPFSNADIKNRSVALSRVGSDAVINSGFGFTKFIFNNDTAPFYNTLQNEYNISNGVFTSSINQTMQFTAKVLINLNFTLTSAANVQRFNDIVSSFNFRANMFYVIINDGRTTSGLIDVSSIIENHTAVLNVANSLDGVVNLSQELVIESGKSFTLEFRSFVTANDTNTPPDLVFSPTLTIKIGSECKITSKKTIATEGDTVDPTGTINKEVTQADLLSSVIKRFNLHLEYDKINDTVINIEPKNDFYTNEVLDLTQVVDRFKSYDIEPVGLVDGNEYVFSDQEGEDVLSKVYKTSLNEVYGLAKYEIDNDFVKKAKKIETIFTPTILESSSSQSDHIISSCRFENDKGDAVEGKDKLRLLYWGGVQPTARDFVLLSGFRVPGTQRQGQTRFNSYPYAGHLDNPFNPTFDLNWGVAKKLYYDFSYTGSNLITFPNSNCFNVFWRNDIIELTDKNSKILKCFIAIRPDLYDEMTFRKLYHIDGSNWRLLKVQDYNVAANQTTLCVFIKVDPAAQLTTSVVEVLGGDGVFGATGEVVPFLELDGRPNGSTGGNLDSLIYGDDVQSAYRSIIVSNNVITTTGVQNVTVLNSDSAVITGDNAVAINSPSKVVNSGDVFINRLFIERVFELELTEDALSELSSNYEVLPELPSNQFYEITRGVVRMIGDTIGGTHKLGFFSGAVTQPVAEIKAAFFSTPNNVQRIDVLNNEIYFANNINMQSANEMTFGAGAVLKINLMYKIIEI